MPPLAAEGVAAAAAAAASAFSPAPSVSPSSEAAVEGVGLRPLRPVVEPACVVVAVERGVAAMGGPSTLADSDRRVLIGMNHRSHRTLTNRPIAEIVDGGLMNTYAKNCVDIWLWCEEIWEAKSAFKFGFPPL